MRKFFRWLINRVPELLEIALFIIAVIIMYYFYQDERKTPSFSYGDISDK